MPRPLAVIILAAGKGTRTKVSVSKVLLPLCGRTLAGTVVDECAALAPDRTVVVVHHQKEQVEKALSGARIGGEPLVFVDQGDPKGTGHAVQVAMAQLADFDGDVLITYGDMPLVTTQTLESLRAARGDHPASVLTAVPLDPTGLGRILRDAEGNVVAVREDKDCSDAEREIDEINAGVYCCDAAALRPALAALSTDNAQGEYYLTDIVGYFVDQGQSVVGFEVDDEAEVQGINSLDQLAMARAIMQERILMDHLLNGVIIEDPNTTYIDHGVEIGADTTVLPCTVIRRGARIGRGCEVGPFAQLRTGAVLEDGACIGNYVEVKNSTIGPGAKAKHLTYLGNATVGAKANIGAGTITANYDGVNKHPTEIGARAFIGSGAVLVAPTKVGDGALVGAGAIVKPNSVIDDEDVWVGVPARRLRARAPQEKK